MASGEPGGELSRGGKLPTWYRRSLGLLQDIDHTIEPLENVINPAALISLLVQKPPQSGDDHLHFQQFRNHGPIDISGHGELPGEGGQGRGIS